MNGKVNGRIYVGRSGSPVEFSNNDLHSYVVANDGRAYVAISSIPASVGHSLQPLASVGGVIGWAFALEQPEYMNGFSIVGKRIPYDVNKSMQNTSQNFRQTRLNISILKRYFKNFF